MSLRKKSAIVLFGVMALGLSAHMMASAVSEIGDVGNKILQIVKDSDAKNDSHTSDAIDENKNGANAQKQLQKIQDRIQEIRMSLIPACLIVNGFLLMLAMLYWFNDGKRPEMIISNRKKGLNISKSTTDKNIRQNSYNKSKSNGKSKAHIESNQKKMNKSKISNKSDIFLNINNNNSNNIIISKNYDKNKDNDKNNVFLNSLSENKFRFEENTINYINKNLNNDEYEDVRDLALKDFKKQFDSINNKNDGDYEEALEDLRSRVVEFKKEFSQYLVCKKVEVKSLDFFRSFNELNGRIQKIVKEYTGKVKDSNFLDSLRRNKFTFQQSTFNKINEKLGEKEYYAARNFALSDFKDQYHKTVKIGNRDLMIDLRDKVYKFREEFSAYLKLNWKKNLACYNFFVDFTKLINNLENMIEKNPEGLGLVESLTSCNNL